MVRKRFKNKKVVIISTAILSILAIITFIVIFYSTKSYKENLILSDLYKLEKIFNEINKTAVIIDFTQNRNFIDFLNVKSFSGSIIGSMNLKYPQKWKGPYLQTNITLDGKFYEILKAKDGYYIAPPQGTKLPNKLVLGKDITINPETDVQKLLLENKLKINNKTYVRKIDNNKDKTVKQKVLDPVFSLGDDEIGD